MKDGKNPHQFITTESNNDMTTLRQIFVDRLKNAGMIRTPRVEAAFRAVPRHMFVPDTDRETAYQDAHIVTRWQGDTPISSCSQPSITAMMLEMLDLQPGQRILEIGAGTGYAAALMAHIVGETGKVITIDLDEDIVDSALKHLQAAGVNNVQVICHDGVQGWQKAAPYDRVILTVASADIAPAWREQLRTGGRMVLPFQLTAFQSELATPPDQLLLALKQTSTCLESIDIRPCFFMTLRGASATQLTGPIALTAEADITCVTTTEIDPRKAFMSLNNPPQDETTSVPVTFPELGGLRLWLALRELCYCELSVKGNAASTSTIPPLLRRTDTFIATTGLYEQSTWCLLGLEEDTSQTTDRKRPFRLTIRRFGPDNTLAQRLQAQIIAWESAGRPLAWNTNGTMEHLQLRAYSLEAGCIPQAHEILLTRQWTQFVITPQLHRTG